MLVPRSVPARFRRPKENACLAGGVALLRGGISFVGERAPPLPRTDTLALARSCWKSRPSSAKAGSSRARFIASTPSTT